METVQIPKIIKSKNYTSPLKHKIKNHSKVKNLLRK